MLRVVITCLTLLALFTFCSGTGEDCEHAKLIFPFIGYSGSFVDGFSEGDLKYPTCSNVSGPSYYFTYTVQQNNQSLVFDACGTSFPSVISVFSKEDDSCDSLVCEGSMIVSCSPLEFTNGFIAGSELLISISGQTGNDSGNYNLIIIDGDTPPVINDSCDNAITVTKNSVITGDTRISGKSISYLGMPTDCLSGGTSGTQSRALFYTYQITLDNAVFVSSLCYSNTTMDTFMTVWTGTCSSLVCDSFSDDDCQFLSEVIISGLSVGTTVIIGVSGYDSDETGPFSLFVDEFTTNQECNDAIILSNNISRKAVITSDMPLFSDFSTIITLCGTTNTARSIILFKYTTLFDNQDITITSCNEQDFFGDKYEINVFTGDCISGLTCVQIDSCAMVLPGLFSQGTDLYISILSFDDEAGFDILIQEQEFIPASTICDNAPYLENYISIYGDINDETLYFKYITLYNFSRIVFSACGTDNILDVTLSGYTGTCSNLEEFYELYRNTGSSCEQFYELKTYQYYSEDYNEYYNTGYPSGTELIFDLYSTDSGNFQITVMEFDSKTIPLEPVSCSNPIPLVNGVAVSGDNYPLYFIEDTGIIPCAEEIPEVKIAFYSYITQYNNGILTISTCGTPVQAVLNVRTGNCDDNLNCLPRDISGCPLDDAQVLTFSNRPKGEYLIISYQTELFSESGPFQITVNEVPPSGTDCSTAPEIFNGDTYIGNTSGGEIFTVFSYPNCNGGGSSQVEFLKYTTLYDFGTLRVSLCSSLTGFDTSITLYENSNSCLSLSCLVSNDDFCGSSSEVTIDTLESGTEILIAIYSLNLENGVFELFLEELMPPPSNGECSSAQEIFNDQTLSGTNENSLTLLSSLPTTCIYAELLSETVFYTYTTVYDFGEITISTCSPNTNFDSILVVYTGTCSNLNCFRSDDDSGCGNSSEISLFNVFPINTELIIAVGGFHTDVGDFDITVNEKRKRPINQFCADAIPLVNLVSTSGYTERSLTTADTLPISCSFSSLAPVVFYKYTTMFDNGDILIDTCGDNQMDTIVSVFLGDCNSLICLDANDDACGSQSIVSITDTEEKVLAGTQLTIAVFGPGINFGDFQILVTESEDPCTIPPILDCPQDVIVFTDHSCNLGIQCATIPNFDFGTCIPPDNSCSCQEEQVNGIVPGSESLAGIYSVETVAIGEFGESNHCFFNVDVQNSCNPSGPILECVADEITLFTSSDCQLDNGNPCTIMESFPLASCSDYSTCTCIVFQSSGPIPGENIGVGEYTIIVNSIDEFGIGAIPCSITIHVELNPFEVSNTPTITPKPSISPSITSSNTATISNTPAKSLILVAPSILTSNGPIPSVTPSHSKTPTTESQQENEFEIIELDNQILISRNEEVLFSVDRYSDNGYLVKVASIYNRFPESTIGEDAISSIIVDVQFADSSVDSSNFGGNIEICFKSFGDTDDLCLGYLDESDFPPTWKCEDKCLDNNDLDFECGNTPHLTNFALLLGDVSNYGRGRCNSSFDWITTSWIGDLILIISLAAFMIVCGLILIFLGSINTPVRSFIYGTEGSRILKVREARDSFSAPSSSV